MDKTEFNLSEKRKEDCIDGYYHEKDVKEFIRLLKEEIRKYCNNKDRLIYMEMFLRDIDKLAGDKLCQI